MPAVKKTSKAYVTAIFPYGNALLAEVGDIGRLGLVI